MDRIATTTQAVHLTPSWKLRTLTFWHPLYRNTVTADFWAATDEEALRRACVFVGDINGKLASYGVQTRVRLPVALCVEG